jgi:hypothetical protein
LELCGKSSEICCKKIIFQNELQFVKRQPEKKLSFKNAKAAEFVCGKKQVGVSQLGRCEIQNFLNLLF